MIRLNDNKQRDLFDPWDHLGPKRRKLLDESWPGFFRDKILNRLPVHELTPAFHQNMGRPTKDLYSMVGLLIFQNMFDKTDEETIESFCFDIRIHYALNIQSESDKAKYISAKTLWNFRQLLIDYGLEDVIFTDIAQALSGLFGVDPSLQRIDSVHVKSNMKKMGRIALIAKTTTKFLTNLKRHHRILYDKLDQQLRDRYMKKGSTSAFAMVKPSESTKTLNQVGQDLFHLVQSFKNHSDVISMSSYKLMARVLDDQCTVSSCPSNSGHLTVELKPGKKVPSTALQNPSDPDAAYSRRKGQGYQAQIQETYTTEEDPVKKAQTLNLITHVEVEPANCPDSDALIPALKSTSDKGLAPIKLAGDTAYGGDGNVQKADKIGVEIIAPAPGGIEISRLSAFTFHENGTIATCPMGHAPVKIRKNKYSISYDFKKDTCSGCEHFSDCLAEKGKKYYIVRYQEKHFRLTERRKKEKAPEFIEAYRWRAGAEATMSQLAQKTGAKKLRVRGLKAVRFSIKLKAVGINLLRAAAARKARKRQGAGPLHLILNTIQAILPPEGAKMATFGFGLKIFQRTEQGEHQFAQYAA